MKKIWKIYFKCSKCGRNVHLIDHQRSFKIQPNIKNVINIFGHQRQVFLNLNKVLNFFYEKLVDAGAKFLIGQCR